MSNVAYIRTKTYTYHSDFLFFLLLVEETEKVQKKVQTNVTKSVTQSTEHSSEVIGE